MNNTHLNKHISYIFILTLFTIIAHNTSSYAQISDGQSKFVGNIFYGGEVPYLFDTYWNQITPENSGKWESVESTRDTMNWGDLDVAYNHAQVQNLPFKQHTLVWGLQEPGWVVGLSAAEQATEVEEWIQSYCARYPDTDMIDVVNEPLHVIPSYSDAIGGSGSTGWDWVVWSFQKARQHCPGAELHLNDYGILGNRRNTTQYVQIINILKDQNLIDGIGLQAHGLEYAQNSKIQNSLDDLAATGIPIYISELDLEFEDDQAQLNRFQSLWPLLYEHPGVVGVTLWGYINGRHWKPNAYLLGSSSTLGSWTVSTAFSDYSTNGTGDIQVHFTNDDIDNDIVVDYAIIDGIVYQAEDQATNTAAFLNGSCGGGGFSDQMNCTGYIQFPFAQNSITVRAQGATGDENLEVRVVDPNQERPALTWLRETYFGNSGGNSSPTASFSSSNSGLMVNYDATASSDSDGSIVSWDWDFGDGTNGSGETTSHTYASEGTYSVTLTVTDNEGAAGALTQAVNVSEGGSSGNTLHVQNIITYGQGVGQGNKKGTAEVTIHDENENPVNGATVSGTFSGTFNETASGVTDANGVAVISTIATAKGGVTVNFCVDNVTHPNLVYDSNANDLTCNPNSKVNPFIEENSDISDFQLSDNYPNPFNPTTQISFSIPYASKVTLEVFNLSGQKVSQLINGEYAKGEYNITFNASTLSSGIYIYRLSAEGFSQTKRMVLIK